ncbi:MotA/TolQ/ExbB proton channel family protein [Myxococcus sp. AM001]|jgi:biopolymer transport protein ExbB|nr:MULTISPECIES: MotA/TolQ/ExbB proton channel family protein [Myxococcus]NVJ08930.1 MotA/TolQ/ExbB proton channel family protein [Myxococcus sp. AM001]NVI97198.1 MotA/TolQ/ExbB proton channel family protein [Myxococcus sp. AM009]NVJ13487.1 MotA/TolQ/ExbB proton channel family protein [Myxococcus sp. AM010]WAM25914.1 MotA/TolQ/ExbB proton channel family protein [Myxococcus sp. NMCA1]WIG93504.1 MotA/TolQ/ExbB proton channel family protein [Myxococcus sp. SDU36]
MNLASVTNLTVLANVGGPQRGFFEEVAMRWEAGQWGMYPIAACLIVALAIMVERSIILFGKASINKEAFLRGLKKHIYAGDLDKAINYVAGQKSTPLTNVIKAGLMNVPKGNDEVQAALDEASLRETPKIEARTGYLAMLGNAAMLAGLLGTVSGLIACFEAVANVNPADKATILANGISEAMNCTGFGLLTAIPALISFSVLTGRTQSLINDINETSVSVLNLIVANKDKFKNLNVPTSARDEE